MKKGLSLLIMLVVSFTCYSQVKVGFKAGVNSSTIVYRDIQGWNESTDAERFRIGYFFGGSSKIALGKKFALQSELLFSLKGEKATVAEGDFRSRAYYLNLPLLMSYNPFEKIFFIAGPELGYLIDDVFLDPYDKKYERPDRFKTLDLGVIAGTGYEILPSLIVEFRYIHGLYNVQRWRDLTFGRNRVFQLGIAYQLSKRNKLPPTTE